MTTLRAYLTRPRKHTPRRQSGHPTPHRGTQHVHTPPPISLSIR